MSTLHHLNKVSKQQGKSHAKPLLQKALEREKSNIKYFEMMAKEWGEGLYPCAGRTREYRGHLERAQLMVKVYEHMLKTSFNYWGYHI